MARFHAARGNGANVDSVGRRPLRRSSRRNSLGSKASQRRFGQMEALEPRHLLSANPLLPSNDDLFTVDHQIVADETPGPVALDMADAVIYGTGTPFTEQELLDMGVVAVQWQGQDTWAFEDQWIARVDSVGTGTRTEQVTAAQTMLDQVAADTDLGPMTVRKQLGMDGVFSFNTAEGTTADQLTAAFSNVDGFQYVEPNFLAWVDSTNPDDTAPADTIPNDPYWGSSGLYGLPKIQAEKAWDVTTGGQSDLVVVVIDTGIDSNHPDLADNMWSNPGEIAGNGIDDDGNGYVDDTWGWNFYGNNNNPYDDNRHGTHCAGTIAGVGNNGVGVVGVNWNAQLMAVKFLSSGGSGSYEDAIASVNYTAMMLENGTNVLVNSNSWGGSGTSSGLEQAIERYGDAGGLFVAAAGNHGSTTRHYPAGFNTPNIVSVAASDSGDNKASFSAYGTDWVDIAAPGVDILSTVPGSGYSSLSGTSMATPHTAGAAALLWDLAGPDKVTWQEIQQTLYDGVDQVGSWPSWVSSGGRLNVFNSMNLLDLEWSVASSSPAEGDFVNLPLTEFTVDFEDTFDSASVDAADFTVNGTAANSYTIVDADTIRFEYTTTPMTTSGWQTMAIADGALERGDDAKPITAWSAQFEYDAEPLQVTSAVPTDGSAISVPVTAIQLNFSEAFDPSTVQAADLQVDQGTVTGVQLIDEDSVLFELDGVIDENAATFNISLAAGAISDAFGYPSLAYDGMYYLDSGAGEITNLIAVEPLGSMAYRTTNPIGGMIGPVGDVDEYTLALDAGQTLSVAVEPGSGLHGRLELRDSQDNTLVVVVPDAAGEQAVLQTFAIDADDTYTLLISGAAETIGPYNMEVALNAWLEVSDPDAAGSAGAAGAAGNEGAGTATGSQVREDQITVDQLSPDGNAIELKYTMPELELVDAGQNDAGEALHQAVLGGAPLLSRTGVARLPVVPARIIVPHGYEVDQIQVTAGNRNVLEGSYLLQQAGQLYPFVIDDVDPGELQAAEGDLDPLASQGVAPVAGMLFETVGTYSRRGTTILNVNLLPVEYATGDGSLAWYEDLTVRVTLQETTDSDTTEIRYRPDPMRPLEREVDNPWTLAGYAGAEQDIEVLGITDPADSYDYVIVTSAALKNSTADYTLQDLADWKASRGLDSTIVTIEDIYANYSGVDNAEKLRNFVIDAYNHWETDFVLLGGDTNILPYRGLYAYASGYTADLPSDLYFQCLDGSFNNDGDSRWGEPNDGADGGDVDLLAEVYIGRAPAENEAEMANWVYKTIAHEQDSGSEHRFGAVMVGEHLGFGGVSEYAKSSMEEIRTGTSNHGYTTKGFAENPEFTVDSLYDADGSWSKSTLMNMFNSGQHANYNHLGHANTSYVMKMYNSDADSLSNDAFFFVYSQGCLPGNFPSNSIAEHFTTSTRSGAFAVVFNANYGWGMYNSTDGPSQRINRQFWDALFSEEFTEYGALNADSHEDNIWCINDDCIRWCVYESNLFGDPAVDVVAIDWTVTGSNPAEGSLINEPLTDFTLDFEEAFDPVSLDAADFEVNNLSADAFTVIDSDTVTFSFATSPLTTSGDQVMELLDGAVLRDSDGRPVRGWTGTFEFDAEPMQVVASSPPDGSAIGAPLAAIQFHFSEAYDAATVDASDLSVSQGSVTGVEMIDADTIQFNLDGVIDPGEAVFTASIATGAMTDAFGYPNLQCDCIFYFDATSNNLTGAVDIESAFIDLPTGQGAQRAAVLASLEDAFTPSEVDVASDSFETALGDAWSTWSSTPAGQVDVTADHGAVSMPGALVMDRAGTGDFNLNEAVWTVDLDGTRRPMLRFWHANFGDEAHAFAGGAFTGHQNADGVAISIDGTTWYPIFDAPAQPTTLWQQYEIDLAQAAADAGITLGDSVQIKFQQYDNGEAPSDGRGWDNLAIRAEVPPRDIYSFDLQAGQTASLALKNGGAEELVLELLDASGEVLVTGLALQGANYEQSIEGFTAEAAGTYYARVRGFLPSQQPYNLVITRGAAFDTEPNDMAGSGQDLGATGIALGALEYAAATDTYLISVNAGDEITIGTATPADGSGLIDNPLDPAVELLDVNGQVVASDQNGAPDGRNASLSYTATDSGLYAVRIVGEAGTSGEYTIRVTGHTGGELPFVVSQATPAPGDYLDETPTEMTIDFSLNIQPTTVEAEDLLIDGVAATSVAVVDQNTLRFTLPALEESEHTVALAEGAIESLQGRQLEAYTSSFTIDLTAPSVISSSIAQHEWLPTGSLTYTATFDEPLVAQQIEVDDFALVSGSSGELLAPTTFSYDVESSTLTIEYAEIFEDSYTLTLFSGDGALEDRAGWDLDGDSDGQPGGDFVVHFQAEPTAAAYPTPLEAKLPVGSLIYDPIVDSKIDFAGDTDQWTLPLDAGQSLTLLLQTDSSLQGNITVQDSTGMTIAQTTATGAGDPVLLQTVEIAANDTYSIIVGEVGETTGDYSLQAVLNAALEKEPITGSANDSLAAAQNIDSTFIALTDATDRGAVLGSMETGTSAQDWYAMTLDGTTPITVALDGEGSGGLSFEVYSATGSLLTSSVAVTEGNVEHIVPGLVVGDPGSYYVRVIGDVATVEDYRLLITRGASFDTEPNSTRGSGQDLGQAGVALGAIADGITQSSDSDYYLIAANTGDSLQITTATPGDGTGEPVNVLDPAIEVYDRAGNLVAEATGGAPDGRNVTLSVPLTADDVYSIRVYSESGSAGEYVLSVTGSTAGPLPFIVTGSTPGDGDLLNSVPTHATVELSASMLLNTLDPEDLTVDGHPATSVERIGPGLLRFGLPAEIEEGEHTFEIAAGAIASLDGRDLEAYSATFDIDLTPPVITSSSHQDHQWVHTGEFTYQAVFSEPLVGDQIDAADFELLALDDQQIVTPADFSYDASSSTLTLSYAALTEQSYQLTLRSGDGALEDLAGWDLDGEWTGPVPPGQSGDGQPGGDFVITFHAEPVSSEFPTPLDPKDPLGSLIYDSIAGSQIDFVGDTDDWTVQLDAGQTLTLLIEPGGTLQPRGSVYDPAGQEITSAVSAGPGQTLLLQTLPITAAGQYTLRVGGASSTTGNYNARTILNAAFENETITGTRNDEISDAEDITESFTSLGGVGDRGAVLGQVTGTDRLAVLQEDFDDGQLGADWTTASYYVDGGGQYTDDPDGRIVIENKYYLGDLPSEPYAMVMYRQPTSSFRFTLNEAIWNVNLSGVANPYLEFWAFDIDEDPHYFSGGPFTGHENADGVAISNDGETWHPVWDLTNIPKDQWTKVVLDISSIEQDTGISLADDVYVKFQQYDNYPPPTDGLAFDDIAITAAGSSDVYSFGLGQDESATIAMAHSSFANISMDLLDGDGNVLASGGPSGGGELASVIENFVASAPDTYYVRVMGSTDQTLDYSLTALRGSNFHVEPNNAPLLSSAQQLGSAGGALGAITPEGDFDVYQIDLAPNDVLYANTLLPARGTGEFVNDLNPMLQLFGPDGEEVASDQDSGEGTNARIVYQVGADAAGTYYIAVSAEAATTGEYVLEAAVAEEVDEPPTVALACDCPSPVSTSEVTFTATFSEWVDNVDPTDFALTGDGITGAAVGEVVGDGTVFTITVDAGTGDGTLGLTIDPGTDITDSVGNGLVVTPTNREEYTIDRTAPQVSEVLAAGSGWGQSFLDYLAAEGLGDGGYAIAGDGGQLAPLPWSNTDQLIVRFTEPVDVELNDLDLIGVNTSQYTPQSIETRQLPDGRFEAKWRLESALAVDKLLAHLASDAITDPAGNPLDGEWSNGAQLGPSGDGQPGGDFDFRFNALPGDIDRDAFVGVLDINPMRNGLGKAAGQSGYDSAADLDGDGFIGVLDINPLRDGLGTSLPTEEPEVPQTTGDRFAEMADLVFGSLADDDDEDEDETDGPLTIESTLATSL